MNYIVLEAQTTGGTTATLVSSYSDRNQAESKYHTVLAAAAISQIEKHTAVLMDETGLCIRSQCYEHGGNNA